MSIKQSLHQAVEALPESVTLEEAFERLYSAFKLKQARTQGQRMADVLEELARVDALGEVAVPVRWQQDLRADRPRATPS
jgi:hypothetical protein